MKFTLRSASSFALIAGIVSTGSAWAQEAPATVTTQEQASAAAPQQAAPDQTTVLEEPQGAVDRVVVTGSLVQGASEDAPLPVASFNLEDLAEQGAPTAAEFLRSLTFSTEAAGEADSTIAGAAAGFANVNLRGLGASRTMVLLNGRRFATTDGGAGADINTLPMMAIGRIDVLKDGASVTYGAGAVGGVINYITRKNFEGFEVNVERKLFDGSDGEYNVEALWGARGENSNFLFGASWGKREPLNAMERDFSTRPYTDLPAIWGVFDNNPGTYYKATNNAISAVLRDYTPTTCRAIGGEISNVLNPYFNVSGTNGAPASNASDCATYLPQYFNLIDEEIYTRGYFEYNADINDNQRFHFEVSYGKTDNPDLNAGPSLPSGGKRATETLRASSVGLFQIPYSQQTYSTLGAATGQSFVNPYAAEFYARAAASGYAIGTPGTLYTSNQWRPLSIGGHPLYGGGGRREKQSRERFGGSVSLAGDFIEEGLFGRFLPEDTTYEFAATYNQYTQESSRPDWLTSRLQDALRGYGGASCQAVDRVPTVIGRVPDRSEYPAGAAGTTAFNAAVAAVYAAYDASVGIQSDTAPGTNGCQYFNPFASSFATSSINGAANPAYGGAAYENSLALLDWMTHDRRYESTSNALTIEATFTGKVPGFELPGGPIAWAVGSQWRQTEARGEPVNESELLNQIASSNCPWGDTGLPGNYVGQSACLAQVGPYFGSGIDRQQVTKTDRQTISYYGELQLPILDNLNVQLAGRREDFGSITGDIWKIAGKYDVLPDLSFRASYSTNFQAPPEDIGVLGVQNGSSYIGSLLRSVNTRITTVPGITPEDDTGANIGVIYAPEIGGGQLRASLDFFEFTVIGEIANTSLTTVLTNVFGGISPTPATLANCNASMINFITFVNGPCSTAAPPTGAQIDSIAQYTLNTGGFITNGLDYNIDYTIDLGPGTLFAGASATQTLVYKVKGFGVPGVINTYQGSFDGLGYANLGRAGVIAPEWRANATVRYALDEHAFTLRTNYISGFQDDSVLDMVPGSPTYGQDIPSRHTIVGRNPDGTPIYTNFGYGAQDYVDFDFTYIFTPTALDGLNLRFSILNITDEDPVQAQNSNASGISASRTGYYPGYGNPRGRQFELGVSYTF